MINTDGRPTIACGVTRREQFPSQRGLARRVNPPVIGADDFMRYEDGEMSSDEALEFFARLIASGQVWHMQGSYGRMAAQLILAGRITEHGEIVEVES